MGAVARHAAVTCGLVGDCQRRLLKTCASSSSGISDSFPPPSSDGHCKHLENLGVWGV